jgi:hypothetical protein
MCTVLHGLGILRNGSLGAGRRYDFRIAIEKNMLSWISIDPRADPSENCIAVLASALRRHLCDVSG